MFFSVTSADILCCLYFIWLSRHWSGGLWLGCGYCWTWEWFHPAGVALLANRRVVLGTPLVTNVNFTSNEKILLMLDCNS